MIAIRQPQHTCKWSKVVGDLKWVPAVSTSQQFYNQWSTNRLLLQYKQGTHTELWEIVRQTERGRALKGHQPTFEEWVVVFCRQHQSVFLQRRAAGDNEGPSELPWQWLVCPCQLLEHSLTDWTHLHGELQGQQNSWNIKLNNIYIYIYIYSVMKWHFFNWLLLYTIVNIRS